MVYQNQSLSFISLRNYYCQWGGGRLFLWQAYSYDKHLKEYYMHVWKKKSILFTYLSIFAHLLLQARHYCQINATVPVLQRFFQGEDTRPDFRLSRQAIQVLLGVLQTERQHGWGPTMETLVFLFWIATGAAYRVVSRAFGIPMSSVHRMVHSIAEEVVAVRGSFIKLPSNNNNNNNPFNLEAPFKTPKVTLHSI